MFLFVAERLVPTSVVFGMTRLGIEPESTFSVADALTTYRLQTILN